MMLSQFEYKTFRFGDNPIAIKSHSYYPNNYTQLYLRNSAYLLNYKDHNALDYELC